MTKSDTREALLSAARTVFARRGYDGATVKELAEAAGVNVSLVSYHFEGKENLYRACVERFGIDRLAAAERMLKVPESVEDLRLRIQLFCEEFLLCHVQEPDLSTIIHRECGGEMILIKDIFINVFVKVFETLIRFFEGARARKLIRADVDCHIHSMLFMGSLTNIVRMDSLHLELFHSSIKDPAYRESIVQQISKSLIEGIIP
ncbi:MAG: TetR/AcrR family transcriptional regulator [Methylotenera sp.]|nr:TetR/AcrR family transcriptional regulator [Oligoflexia bacterium]